METQTTQDTLTLLRLHLCDLLEPVSPHLTVTRLMGLAKALPADKMVINTESGIVKGKTLRQNEHDNFSIFPRKIRERKCREE